MKKQIIFSLIGSLLFIILLGLFKFLQIARAIEDSKKFAPPPDAITTVKIVEEIWPQELPVVASLSSVNGAILSAETQGKVSKILFESGQKIEAGQTLVELDTSVEEADLKAAIARMDFAKRNFLRSQTLRQKNANSQSDLDDAAAKAREAEANAESLKSMILRKRIVAPFTGRAGIRKVNIGEFVIAGKEIVPFYSLDPLYINFSLPESKSTLVSIGNKVRIKVETLPNEEFVGNITAINPQINDVNKSLELQATISNAGEKLLPGMFAHAIINLGKDDNVIAIPASSISYAPYGDTVFVIEKMKGENGVEYLGARQQVVKAGEKRGDMISILSGLKVGEEVATAGVFKLRPNAPVKINNSLLPPANLYPQPKDT